MTSVLWCNHQVNNSIIFALYIYIYFLFVLFSVFILNSILVVLLSFCHFYSILFNVFLLFTLLYFSFCILVLKLQLMLFQIVANVLSYFNLSLIKSNIFI